MGASVSRTNAVATRETSVVASSSPSSSAVSSTTTNSSHCHPHPAVVASCGEDHQQLVRRDNRVGDRCVAVVGDSQQSSSPGAAAAAARQYFAPSETGQLKQVEDETKSQVILWLGFC